MKQSPYHHHRLKGFKLLIIVFLLIRFGDSNIQNLKQDQLYLSLNDSIPQIEESEGRSLLSAASTLINTFMETLRDMKRMRKDLLKTFELMEKNPDEFLIKFMNLSSIGSTSNDITNILQSYNKSRSSLAFKNIDQKSDEENFSEEYETMKFDSNGKIIRRSGSVSESEEEEDQVNKLRQEQSIINPLTSVGTSGAALIATVPFLIANLVMALVMMGLNISIRSDNPRLTELHQQQINALARIGGVPQELVDPTNVDSIEDGDGLRNELSSSEDIDRIGYSSDVPLNIMNNYVIQELKKVIRIALIWSLVGFFIQAYYGSVTPGTVILSLIAIVDIYNNYYNNGFKGRSYSKSIPTHHSYSLDEIFDRVIEAIDKLTYLQEEK